MHAEDHELVGRASRGDPQAAAEVIDRHYPALYAFLRRLAGNATDADDLTQRTFAEVWVSLSRFAGRSSLRSWLHGVAYHVYQGWLRANHRTQAESDEWWQAWPDERPGPDAVAAHADLAAALYAAVDHLEADLRSAVHLHYYQGLTLEETAEVVGMSASTVKYRLRHALELLQRRLADGRPGAPALLNHRKP